MNEIEREIFTMLGKGFWQKEIAKELKLSPSQVSRRVKKVAKELNARNGLHALYLSLVSGLVVIEE